MVNAQRGIALIQVLLLCTILTLLAVHYSRSSGFHVETAVNVHNKLHAYLMHRTTQSRILYSMLSQPKNVYDSQYTQVDEIRKVWNFHGQPFYIDAEETVKIQLQDLNGLLSLYGNRDNNALRRVLRRAGKSDNEARRLVDAVNHWQGNPVVWATNLFSANARGNMLASDKELALIDGLDEGTIALISSVATPLATPHANPFNAPDALMWFWIDNEKVLQHVLDKRKNVQLGQLDFAALTDINDGDEISLSTGRRIIVHIRATVGNADVESKRTYYIRPENKIPLLALQ